MNESKGLKVFQCSVWLKEQSVVVQASFSLFAVTCFFKSLLPFVSSCSVLAVCVGKQLPPSGPGIPFPLPKQELRFWCRYLHLDSVCCSEGLLPHLYRVQKSLGVCFSPVGMTAALSTSATSRGFLVNYETHTILVHGKHLACCFLRIRLWRAEQELREKSVRRALKSNRKENK